MRARRTSGVTRCVVASWATCFAPFSQNSTSPRCSGSGQAQPGQSKPSSWFTREERARAAHQARLAHARKPTGARDDGTRAAARPGRSPLSRATRLARRP